jgi:glycosyltransferase involved in cell wall biosynthesis
MIESYPDFIEYKGKIYDKEKLANIMQQSSLFVMPSINETFGLVYIEALSQNLPVIYSKGQGIDGLFDETVGIRVNALSVDEIRDAIRNILENPNKYSNNKVSFTDFDWKNIAEKYIGFYQDAIELPY